MCKKWTGNEFVIHASGWRSVISDHHWLSSLVTNKLLDWI